ncbi:MAG: TetR family transcriptional regulator [Dehalococcoidia bacterium]|jgi:AcrR family transcriptional regulator
MQTKVKKGIVAKAAIIDTAIKLFYNQGYAGTSLRNIAKNCGFEPANLYNYFQSKEQLLYEAEREDLEDLLSRLEHNDEKIEGGPPERLKKFIEIWVDQATKNASLGMVYDSEFRHLKASHKERIINLRDSIEKLLIGILVAGRKTGDFADVDVKIAAFSISGMIMRTGLWFSSRGRLSSSEVAEALYHFALKGIELRQTNGPQ